MKSGWAGPLRWDLSGEEFAEAAGRLLRRQAAYNPVYADYLATFPDFRADEAAWEDFPALPVELFRNRRILCGPEQNGDFYFETSGSTSERRGRHWFHQAGFYEKSLELAFRRLMPDVESHAWLRLIPAKSDRPHSSLGHMIDFLAGLKPGRKEKVCVDADFRIGAEAAWTALEKDFAGESVAIFATSFAIVQLAEIFQEQGRRLRLPGNSLLFETGGYKGRHRELSHGEFLELMDEVFGLKPEAIWNEYGMTELSSQCYARASEGIHRAPPWLKVRIIDPLTGRLCGEGERGLIEFVDLANVDSVAAIATLDTGAYEGDGFRLFGRLQQAPLRGCSLPYEAGLKR